MTSRFYISAAHKSSGKTTLSLGLAAALSRQGLKVQTFKKGPDYIDPMWLREASGHPCYNLDFNTMQPDEIRALVSRHLQEADIGLIEGNKGLFDGMALDLSNSNAAVARLLETPVILVIDAQGMTRGIAPLLLGYQQFDPHLRIGGVILNKVAGSRHEAKLRETVEHYTDIPVIGAVQRNPELRIDERHLGLVPSNEATGARALIDRIATLIGEQVELSLLRDIAATAPALPAASTATATDNRADVRIGIARDAAFGFYYPDDLEALERAGATLVPIDTLADTALPTIDGLFIGGGFPESCMERLEANAALRHAIRDAIEAGLPTYAECGGLMYLTRSLRWQNRRAEMVGVIPADTVMHTRPQGRGYIVLEEQSPHPWGGAAAAGTIAAHEFHYSRLENFPAGKSRFAYRVVRGSGIDGRHDGYIHRNLLACYAHLRDTAQYHWAARFVDFVRRTKTPRHTGEGDETPSGVIK